MYYLETYTVRLYKNWNGYIFLINDVLQWNIKAENCVDLNRDLKTYICLKKQKFMLNVYILKSRTKF